MKNVIFFLLLSLALLPAQEFDEKSFFNALQKSYYSMSQSGINNFTALVTNSRFETFASEQWDNRETFPLQFIWLSNGRLFLTEQGTPALKDSADISRQQELISDMKSQITGLIWDLKRFYLDGVYNVIEDDYTIRPMEQIVEVRFTTTTEDDTSHYKYFFGLNGLLLKVETFQPAKNTIVETYPSFKVVKSKWLCEGWEVQMRVNGEIETGLIIKITNREINGVWVPDTFLITVQQSKTPGVTYFDAVKFRNYLFNRSLQLINN